MSDQPPPPDINFQNLHESNFPVLFSQAEEAIKIVEHRHGDLIIPAINELRYAGYHISNYISDPTHGNEISKACGHCRRAMYDAYEAGILFCWEEYREFQNDYKNCIITDIIPDYVNQKRKITQSLEFIRSIDKETKIKNYEECKKHHEELIEIVESLNDAREELNKAIQKERSGTQKVIAGLFIAFVTLLVTIVFGVVPLL